VTLDEYTPVAEACAVRRRCVRCGRAEFAAALGLCCRPDGEVRGGASGCVSGVFEDWKIDYGPTRLLLTRA
jgi:hypothetical protein